MSPFDIVINFVEAFICILFIFLIFHKEKEFTPFIITIFIYATSLTFFNYFLFPEIFLTISNYCISICYACYLNKNHIIQNIFISLCIHIFNNISATISMIIINYIYGFPFYSGLPYILLVLISKILLFIIVLFSSLYIKKYNLLQTKKLIYLLTSIIILNLIYSSTTDFIFHNNVLDYYIITIFLLLNLLSLCLFVIFIEAQKEQQYMLSLQKDKLRLETQEQIQTINQSHLEELNKWQHDITHVFNSLDYQLENDNIQEARNIIKQMHTTLSTTQTISKTNNPLLDYLLLQRYEILKEKEIVLIVDYNHCICPLEDTHFCILIGNLLNNAIENCTSHDYKNIVLSIEQKAQFYHIKIKNTIVESVLKNNPNLQSRKEDNENHGIGLKSVQLILSKYKGKISFYEEASYFIVNIIIPIC